MTDEFVDQLFFHFTFSIFEMYVSARKYNESKTVKNGIYIVLHETDLSKQWKQSCELLYENYYGIAFEIEQTVHEYRRNCAEIWK